MAWVVVCVDCGRKVPWDKAMPTKFNRHTAYLCPKCYYAGIPTLMPRYLNPRLGKAKLLARFPLLGDKLIAYLQTTPEWVVWLKGKKAWAILARANNGAIIPYFEVAQGEYRKGLGAKLIKAVEKKARLTGVKFIEIGPTEESEKFWRKMGYSEPRYRPLHGENVPVLQKGL